MIIIFQKNGFLKNLWTKNGFLSKNLCSYYIIQKIIITKDKLENLRKRLAFDELLANLLVFQKLKKKQKKIINL